MDAEKELVMMKLGIEQVLIRLRYSAKEAQEEGDARREIALLRCYDDLRKIKNGEPIFTQVEDGLSEALPGGL